MFIIYIAVISTYFRTSEGVPTDNLIKGSDVLESVPLVDGHNEFMNYLYKKKENNLKDFNFKKNLTDDPIWGSIATDIPRLKVGKIGGQMWSIQPSCDSQYKNAVQLTLSMIDSVKREVQKNNDILEFVTKADDIEKVWKKRKIGSMIAVEGGHSLDSNFAILRMYYDLGVRSITLTSGCKTPWIGSSTESTDTNVKLTDFGKKMVWEMNRLGILIDLTHTQENDMHDILAVTRSPVIFSHSGILTDCNKNLHVSDKILHQVKFNNGIIMIPFHININCDSSRNATLEDVVAIINHIKKKIGVEHLGIGGTFDGSPSSTVGLEDVSKYPALFDRLYENRENEEKWTREDLEKLAGRNFIRVFKTVENVRDCMKWQVPDEDVISSAEVEEAQERANHVVGSCQAKS